MISEGLDRVAFRVLHGDDSIAAARALEAVLIEEFLNDDRTAELLRGLALYGHEDLDPYVHAQEVRDLLMTTLETLSHPLTSAELRREGGQWRYTAGEASGDLAARDFGAAREALVVRVRRDYPRAMWLRWSATGDNVWTGHLPHTV